MKLKHSRIILCIAILLTVSLTAASHAAYSIVASDVMDESVGSWTIDPDLIQAWITGTAAGVSPTAGTDIMHFNNYSTLGAGTNFITFSGVALAPGDYIITLDVGNYNNQPMVIISEIGMTAGGAFLAPATSDVPTPALGGVEEWTFTYSIGASNPNLGQDIGFTITAPVPDPQVFQNGTFDNLVISYQAPVPEPTTMLLLSGAIAGLASRRRGQVSKSG